MSYREGEQSALRLTEEQRAQEETELIAFGEALLPYFHRYLLHLDGTYNSTSPSHPDRMREIGQHVRSIRGSVGLSRKELAQQMDEDPVRLAAFEGGLIPKEDLPEGFPQKLSSILREKLESPKPL